MSTTQILFNLAADQTPGDSKMFVIRFEKICLDK